MYRVEIRWSPAFELFISLTAFVSKRDQPIMDLGPSWARDVRKSLDPRFASLFTWATLDPFYNLVQLSAIHHSEDRGTEEFLVWLAERPVDELLDLGLREGRDRIPRSSAELLAARDRAVEVLSAWNDAYFQHLDPRVLDG